MIKRKICEICGVINKGRDRMKGNWYNEEKTYTTEDLPCVKIVYKERYVSDANNLWMC